MPTHKKNTLLKNASSNPLGNFFKRVFFFTTQKLPPLLKKNLFSPTHRLSAGTTSCVSNVNCFEQSVCLLDSSLIRTDRRASANN